MPQGYKERRGFAKYVDHDALQDTIPKGGRRSPDVCCSTTKKISKQGGNIFQIDQCGRSRRVDKKHENNIEFHAFSFIFFHVVGAVADHFKK